MNVDLIKFVNDDNTITIFTTEEYWQYLYWYNSNTKSAIEIYLVEMYGCGIINWRNVDIGTAIEKLLNIPHQSQVVDMIRYMKGKTI